MRFEAKEEGSVVGWFDVMPQHMGPNGYLHAASIIALIDTAAGYGCFIAKPAAATGFTTIELKANFLSTTTKGRVQGTASMAHSGSRTQVWDAVATCDGKTLALFRCTQMLLYPTGSAR